MIGDAAVIQAVLGTARPDVARGFYTDTLGLKLVSEDQYAMILAGKIGFIRLTKLPAVPPSTHAMLAFDIPDIAAAIAALGDKGVSVERFAFLTHDARGVWTSPDGVQVAWFRDPDMNLLSLIQRPA